MSNGHFSIPRSLSQDPLYKDLPPNYKEVFYVILEHTCYRAQKHDDHGHIIDLLPGQICFSYKSLQALCSKHISLNDVERCVKKLILFNFARQEVRYRKTILTITHRDTYELIIRGSEVKSEVNLRWTRGELEVQTNNEEGKNKYVKETYNVNVEEKVVPLVETSSCLGFPVEESFIVKSSFLLEKEREEKNELLKECFERKWTVTREDVENWYRIFGYQKVKNAFQMRVRNKKSIYKTDARWIQSALIKDYHGSVERNKENFQIAKRIKKDLSWNSLTITDQYCRDDETGKDYVYKCFDPDVFDGLLVKAFSLKLETEREQDANGYLPNP